MQFKTLLLAATAATSALAAPTFDFGFGSNKIPGYPYGIPQCLNDQQAAFIIKTFKSILTNPDRKAAVATANAILDNKFTETSDSINVLAGNPQGSSSFNGKAAYVTGISTAPPIAVMNDLDIWHDCTKIGWQWLVDGLGLDVSPVKGFNKFIVDPNTGIIKSSDLEFNNIAWGEDLGGQWIQGPSNPGH